MNDASNYDNKSATLYDALLSPFEKKLSTWRRRLLAHAHGEVLEIGVGTGLNLQNYPPNVRITGIDASKRMLHRAKRRAKGNNNIEKLLVMDAQELQFATSSFDTVVATCVFCTIENPIEALLEVRRVCRHNGTMEHVRSNKRFLGPMMDFFNPITTFLYDDFINRNTYSNILEAGLAPHDVVVEKMWGDIWKTFRITNRKKIQTET